MAVGDGVPAEGGGNTSLGTRARFAAAVAPDAYLDDYAREIRGHAATNTPSNRERVVPRARFWWCGCPGGTVGGVYPSSERRRTVGAVPSIQVAGDPVVGMTITECTPSSAYFAISRTNSSWLSGLGLWARIVSRIAS